MRYNWLLSGDENLVGLRADRSVGKNQTLILRRARMILSGNVSERLSIYLQPDFASTPAGTSTTHFAQLRDAYADIFFDANKEIRLRAGQSKIPYGFENLQSSQNRLALDRGDALNNCCRDERDIALFLYYTPESTRPVFKDLVQSGLKGSGDYGVLAFGVYNGQGANRFELNGNMHLVTRFTYPYQFENGQVLEAGAEALTGRFRPESKAINGAMPTQSASDSGFLDQRIGFHAALYPKPIGIQAEWNWGRGPKLNDALTAIEEAPLTGGYIQAMYKVDQLASTGNWIPFVKWQYYNGGQKFEANTPRDRVSDLEIGLEWQPRPELELTAVYAHLNRNDLATAPYQNFDADLLRMQLQWNY